MDNDLDHNDWLTYLEQQCVQTIENQPDYDLRLTEENEQFQNRLKCNFHDSAAAIVQLYKDDCSSDPRKQMSLFSEAAITVTSLYQESNGGFEETIELAKKTGYKKRNKEIFDWVKGKGQVINREDFLAFLAGTQNTHHTIPHGDFSPVHSDALNVSPQVTEPNPHMFNEALNNLERDLGETQESSARTDLRSTAGQIARQGVKRALPMDAESPAHQKISKYNDEPADEPMEE